MVEHNEGDSKKLRFLVEGMKLDVNAQCSTLFSNVDLLSMAAKLGRMKDVRYLLNADAKVNEPGVL